MSSWATKDMEKQVSIFSCYLCNLKSYLIETIDPLCRFILNDITGDLDFLNFAHIARSDKSQERSAPSIGI